MCRRNRLFIGALLVLLFDILSQPCLAINHWNSLDDWHFDGSGNKRVVSPGYLILDTEADDVTQVYSLEDVPARYTVRFRQKIDDYGNEQGFVVYDGSFRMMLYFKSSGVAARLSDGSVQNLLSWQSDTSWHDYQIIVDNGTADLYMDGMYRARWEMHPHGRADKIEHWVKGSNRAQIQIDYTDLFDASYSIDELWNTTSNWHQSGSGEIDIIDSEYLRLYTTQTDVTQIYKNDPIPDDYTVYFRQKVVDYGHEQGFVVYNGSYRMMIYFTIAGVHVRQRDGSTIKLIAWDNDKEWHDYYVVVKQKQASIYMDGSFRGEWNMQAHTHGDKIEHWVKGSDSAEILIDYTKLYDDERSPYEYTFSYFDDFEDEQEGSSPSHWMETGTEDTWGGDIWKVVTDNNNKVYRRFGLGSEGSLSLLHAFEKNLFFEGEFKINDATTDSKLYFNIRRNHEESRIVVRYSFSDQKWRIIEREAQNKPVYTRSISDPMPLSNDIHKFQILAFESRVVFWLDDQFVISACGIKKDAYGKIGIQAKKIDLQLDNIVYYGHAPAHDGVREYLINNQDPTTHSAEIVKLANGQLLMGVTGGTKCYKSSDEGNTWDLSSGQKCSTNMLVDRESGDLLMVKRETLESDAGVEDLYRDYVKVSSDNGQTWSGRFYIQEGYKNRITMPNKISQASDNRIFYASGESGDGMEIFGGVWIYYSDNGGRSWTRASTLHDYPTFEINLQEGKVVEVGANQLKAYFRTDLGYLYESLSSDNGDTWSTPRPTLFRSTMCAFNVEKDYVTGKHYMVWEYEDTDEYPDKAGMPRERVALAVSDDNTETWKFVMDVDDWIGHPLRHMNHGLKIIDDMIWIYIPRRYENYDHWEGDFRLRLWRIEKDKVNHFYSFPGTH
ncbi:MAG: sialidase family protein [Myxococcota bacterium]|nr:sialidase family protein [Myxococcota bacterium]